MKLIALSETPNEEANWPWVIPNSEIRLFNRLICSVCNCFFSLSFIVNYFEAAKIVTFRIRVLFFRVVYAAMDCGL